MSDYLTRDELAEMLGKSHRSIKLYAKEKGLPVEYRVANGVAQAVYRREAAEAWIRNRSVK